MSIYSDHAAQLQALQNELGAACPVFFWQEKKIRILPGSMKLKAMNSPGGLSLDSDFKCTAIRSDFGPKLPVSNQLITYEGKRLKLQSVDLAPGGLQVHLEAVDAAQGL